MARCKWSGSPIIRAKPTSETAALSILRRSQCWIECSFRGSCRFGLMIHDGDEQIRDARGADIAQRRELISIDLIEQKNAATEDLSFRDRF